MKSFHAAVVISLFTLLTGCKSTDRNGILSGEYKIQTSEYDYNDHADFDPNDTDPQTRGFEHVSLLDTNDQLKKHMRFSDFKAAIKKPVPALNYNISTKTDRTLFSEGFDRRAKGFHVTPNNYWIDGAWKFEFAVDTVPSMEMWLIQDLMYKIKHAKALGLPRLDVGYNNKYIGGKYQRPVLSIKGRSMKDMLNMIRTLLKMGASKKQAEDIGENCYRANFFWHKLQTVDTGTKEHSEYYNKHVRATKQRQGADNSVCELVQNETYINGVNPFAGNKMRHHVPRNRIEEVIEFDDPELPVSLYHHLFDQTLFANHEKAKRYGLFNSLYKPMGNKMIIALSGQHRNVLERTNALKGVGNEDIRMLAVAYQWLGDHRGWENGDRPTLQKERARNYFANYRKRNPLMWCSNQQISRGVLYSAREHSMQYNCKLKAGRTNEKGRFFWGDDLFAQVRYFGNEATSMMLSKDFHWSPLSHIAMIEFPIYSNKYGVQVTTSKKVVEELEAQKKKYDGKEDVSEYFGTGEPLDIDKLFDDLFDYKLQTDAFVSYINQLPNGKVEGVVIHNRMKYIYNLTELHQWYKKRYTQNHRLSDGMYDYEEAIKSIYAKENPIF